MLVPLLVVCEITPWAMPMSAVKLLVVIRTSERASGFGSTAVSCHAAPWIVVPADHKWFARVVIGSTIVSALDKLDLRFPKVDAASLQEFKKVREALENEGNGGVKKAAK